ncbi:MAG: hypothetical protein NUV80_03165 [Candidatus Berkelbacteria bacterium]|nr:hypothetical protein [Candidatus Berkelbacteria bacterium]
MSDFIEIGNDRAIKLEEYKGTFSITQHRKYNEKWYWVSVRTIKGKDEVSDKNTPAKVQLGDKAAAIKALNAFLAELEDATEDGAPF